MSRQDGDDPNPDDEVVWAPRGQPLPSTDWAEMGAKALDAGDFAVAIKWLKNALQSLPPDVSNQYIISVLTQLGRAHRLAGDLTAARRVMEDTCVIAENAGDTTLILMSAAEFGHTLLNQGDPQLACERMAAALTRSRKLGDPRHVATLLDTHARALVALGDLSEARRVLDQALSIKAKAKDASGRAVSLSLRGVVRAEQGDMVGARDDLGKSLKISKRALGPAHRSVGAILSALAHVDRRAMKPESARDYLNQALVVQRATLGDRHPEVADTLVTLASVLVDSNNLDGALSALDEALAIQQALGDGGQLAAAAIQREIAKVFVARGNLTGALESLRQALVALGRIHGRDVREAVETTHDELRKVEQLQKLHHKLRAQDT